jgi:Do/DeqQ family serine protease
MFRIFLSAIILSLSTSIVLAQEVPQSPQQMNLSFAPVVKQVAPSVINIFTKRVVTRNVSPFMNDPLFAQLFQGMGFPQQRLEGALGTGLIVDEKGLAVTNAHVIRGANEITIALSDGREFPAKLILEDDASDLALLRIDAGNEKLPAARLQSSENLEVGDLVIAIGNPFGVGQTVTSGIISALARSSMNINDYNFFIQTDAAINPGNSGGPLVSMSGGVIGINTAIFSKNGGSLGIGFAIPSEMVNTIIAAEKSGQVSKSGNIVRPWIGMTAQDITSDIASSLGLSAPIGALISDLHEASPAIEAGLKQGDVIIGVNDHMIKDASELRFRLATIALGQEASITYKRNSKDFAAKIKTIIPPDSPARNLTKVKGKNPLDGATLSNINPAVEVEFGLKNPPSKGVVVTEVTQGTLSARVVRVGDVITAVNGNRVSTPEDVKKELEHITRQGWILKVISGGEERTLMVR